MLMLRMENLLGNLKKAVGLFTKVFLPGRDKAKPGKFPMSRMKSARSRGISRCRLALFSNQPNDPRLKAGGFLAIDSLC
jgi:hypothetical protein